MTLLKFHSADEDVIEGSFSIFKAAVFKANYSSSQSRSTGTSMMDSVVPSLLDLLNERNVTSKAVVMLVAEYCFMYVPIYFFSFSLLSAASNSCPWFFYWSNLTCKTW